jgi:hypothetical protein
MTIHKFTLLIPALILLFIGSLYFGTDTAETNQALVDMNVVLNKNTPVYVSGCNTYKSPVVQHKPACPPIRKNFVTRLCALEVFPTNGMIAKENLRMTGNFMPVK